MVRLPWLHSSRHSAHDTQARQSQRIAHSSGAEAGGKTGAELADCKEQSTALPPRVLVEQPDGRVFLGEDDKRLQGETAQDFELRQQAALPRVQQWLALRRLLYGQSLNGLIKKRRRQALAMLGAAQLVLAMACDAANKVSVHGARNVSAIGTWLAHVILGACKVKHVCMRGSCIARAPALTA
jgi:hypothetical protein